MEKQPENNTSITDNELDNITGGSFENGRSYGTDQCGECGMEFRGDASSLEIQENEHREETGHCQFRPID